VLVSAKCALFPSCGWQKRPPIQFCLPLLQALRVSPLAWLHRLAGMLVFSLPCELLWRLGLPPYSPTMYITLTAAWVAGWMYCLLLATQVISGVGVFPFLFAPALFLAVVLGFEHDLAVREADIQMLLVAVPDEAARIMQQLPDGLESLHQRVASFYGSTTAAMALAVRAHTVIRRALDGIDRLAHPWRLLQN
jgi:hypothetical protein